VPCRRAKEYLSRKGIPYTEKDTTEHPEYLQEMEAMGHRSFPLIIVGERRLTRFNPAELEEALAAAGWS
jgi:glutaredoxin